MSLWVTGLERARRKATEVLDTFGIISPAGLARERGIGLRTVAMTGARAQLVGGPRGTFILLADSITDPADLRWSIAHELGHFELGHPAQPIAELCTPRPWPPDRRRRRRCRDLENEADEFAMSLLMQGAIVAGFCDAGPMTMDVVAELANVCGAPLAASAIRITETSHRMCAAVLSQHGAIRWASPSLRFLTYVGDRMPTPGQPLGCGSLARRYFETGRLSDEPREVPGDAWIEELPTATAIQEHSVSIGPSTVLTMLWAPNEPTIPRPCDLGPGLMALVRDLFLSDDQQRAALTAHVAASLARPL